MNLGADVRGHRHDHRWIGIGPPQDLGGGGETVETRHVQVEED